MPAISMFYGIIVYICFMDNKQNGLPHLAVVGENPFKITRQRMNPRVSTVRPAADYILELVFDDGDRRLYDCTHLLELGVFRELHEISYFKQAKVLDGTVVWPHEQDICPDTLYLDSLPLVA